MAHYSLKYYNEQLRIGLADWKTVFVFNKSSQPVQMQPEFQRGQLVYRIPGSSQRISYRKLKKGLIKKAMEVFIPDLVLPF
jgi:hypothetical protein